MLNLIPRWYAHINDSNFVLDDDLYFLNRGKMVYNLKALIYNILKMYFKNVNEVDFSWEKYRSYHLSTCAVIDYTVFTYRLQPYKC